MHTKGWEAGAKDGQGVTHDLDRFPKIWSHFFRYTYIAALATLKRKFL